VDAPAPPTPFAFSGRRRLAVEAACDFEPPVRFVAIHDLERRLQDLLAKPIGSPPLAAVAHGARTVSIAIPDASRPCPTPLLLPALVEHLNRGGVADGQITVVVACGLHRLTTTDEKAALVGPRLAARIHVQDAQGQQPDLLDLGKTGDGCPIVLNSSVANADLVVSLGVVEPHLYAGFSGGLKTVAIGCAGEPTIAWTHDAVFLDRPEIRVGRLDDSPFRLALAGIAARTRLRFAVNVVVDDEGRVAGLTAGDPATAQESLVEAHGPAWWRRRADRYDLVVAGVPAPKHEGLYHASRAATYLTLVDRPVVAQGGLIAVCSDLPLGVGDGPGEMNFGRLLAAAARPEELIDRARRETLGPGGQRAYMVAKVLRGYRLGVIGAADPALLEPLGLLPFATVDEAIAEAQRRRGSEARVLVVADAFDTLVEQDR
jgi:nickel-dependent lactate racemase